MDFTESPVAPRVFALQLALLEIGNVSTDQRFLTVQRFVVGGAEVAYHNPASAQALPNGSLDQQLAQLIHQRSDHSCCGSRDQQRARRAERVQCFVQARPGVGFRRPSKEQDQP
jgi:hypothetical protein